MNIKEIVKISVNLVLIYGIGGLLIAGIYSVTSPIIFQKNAEEKAAALKAMEPLATSDPQKLGDWEPQHKHAEFFRISGDSGSLGFIVETYGKGYSSKINMFVAIDENLTVKKMEVIHHGETPGLGDEILLPEFKAQYIGKTLDKLIVIKGVDAGDRIQAITGATISTRAVTEGVRDAIIMLRDGGKDKEPIPIEPKETKEDTDSTKGGGH